MQLSVIIPSLNQADRVARCILKTQFALERAGVDGEVIVADAGSHDDSVELSLQLGARVISAARRSMTEMIAAGRQSAQGVPVVLAADEEPRVAVWLAEAAAPATTTPLLV